GAELARLYRERFQPSAQRAEPALSAALGVVCAETEAEAQRLAASLEVWRRRIMRGIDRGIPSPEEALGELEEGWVPPGTGVDGARTLAGDPAQVRAELLRVAARYGTDELLLVTVTHDFGARLRSYELVAEAMGLIPPSG
ncbi:MAG TPA: hypothetical protein VFX98_16895, partial [Longimicrobiaceae bacterium]|nr:hypothetical protein [Longimicrobiaceae bacterium]